MKAKFFNSIETINWTRWWFVITIITTVWLGLVTIMPPDVFKWVSVPLSAIQSGMLFAARGSKYVAQRIEPPSEGKL